MKFLVLTLISNGPDPRTGRTPSPHERFRRVVEHAVLAEELGFDGFGVGEHHERPFISSSPPVVLGHLAAVTSGSACSPASRRCRCSTRCASFEDYATLDHLSGGRLELIIGKGNGAAQQELFRVTTEDQWDRNREATSCSAGCWREDKVTWRGPVPAAAARGQGLAAAAAAADPGLARQRHAARRRWTWPPGTATRCSRPTSPTRSSRTPSWSLLPQRWVDHGRDPADVAGRRGHRRLLRRTELAGRLDATGRSSRPRVAGRWRKSRA